MAWHDGLSPDDVRLLLAMGGLLSLGLQGRVAAWLQSARPEQLPPEGVWRVWLILSGRGWGKTRTGAETVISWIAEGTVTHVAIVGQTREDVRNVMVAALLKSAGTDAAFSETHLELTFPSGAVIRGFSAEDPDSLRGHQFDAAWCDELGAWRRPEAFDQLQMCVRVGEGRIIVTTTPRPIPVIRALLADPTTVVTRGRTLDNVANLSQGAVNYLFGRYAGTRLGRQELDGEVLDDVEGALWSRGLIDRARLSASPDLVRVVVAIDPAMTSGPDADETGIVVVGSDGKGHGYVLADLSRRASPDGWARAAVRAFTEFRADRIVGEVNQGGDLVESTLRTVDNAIPFRAVHATRGKRTRAEPCSALYEQGRVHHIGSFPELEDQMCSALPEGGGGPDDRVDALVWALEELGLAGSPLDQPGAIQFASGVWTCLNPTCRHMFSWGSERPCPKCGTKCPPTYDDPVPPPDDYDRD